jgi:enamine deaminase RidA (YjgF/YER057c/UK114 family)
MMSRFTEKAQQALQRAQQLMFNKQHTQLDAEHIFLALLQQRGSIAAEIITSLGGNAQDMAKALDLDLLNRPLPPIPSSGTATGYITMRANRVLQGAAEEADQLNDDFISSEHLFLAIVNESGGVTGKLLREAGITSDKVLRTLLQLRRDPTYVREVAEPAQSPVRGMAPKQIITPPELVKPSGYSHGILATGVRTLYIGGQIATDGDGNLVAPGDVVGQYKQVLKNIWSIVMEADGEMTDIVKLTIYVRDRADYKAHLKELGAVHREYFGNYYPATTLVEVSNFFEDGVLVEIEGVAVL